MMDSIGLRLRELLVYCLLSVLCVCLYVSLSVCSLISTRSNHDSNGAIKKLIKQRMQLKCLRHCTIGLVQRWSQFVV